MSSAPRRGRSNGAGTRSTDSSGRTARTAAASSSRWRPSPRVMLNTSPAASGSKSARTIPSAGVNLKHALQVDTAFWILRGEGLEERFDRWAPPICRQQIDDDDDEYKDQAVCQDVYGNMR